MRRNDLSEWMNTKGDALGVSLRPPVDGRRRVPAVSVRQILLSVLLLTWAAGRPARVTAEGPSAAQPSAVETVTAETIQTRRAQAEQAADLDDATRQKILQMYDQALAALEAASKSASRAAELQARIDGAPAEIRETKAKLAALPSAGPAISAEGKDLPELKQILAEKEADLAKKKEALSALKAELTRRVTAPKDVADQRSVAQGQLAATDKELAALASLDAPAALKLARQTLLLAQRQAIGQSISAYDKELAMYEATRDLLPLQQQLAAEEAARAEEEFTRWRDLVNRRAEAEAKRQAADARREALEADPAFKPLTEANQKLADKAEAAATLIRTESKKLDEINRTLEDVQGQYQRIEERVKKAVGLTNAIGMLMRTRRAGLPNVDDHYRQIRERQSDMRDIQSTLFELEDQRSDMPPTLERHVESELEKIRPKATNIPEHELKATVEDLVSKQRELLRTAIDNHKECFKTLVDLDDAQQKLIREVEAFADYIDRWVLWIRSAEPLGLSDVHYAGWVVVKRLLNPRGASGWAEIAKAIKDDALVRPLFALLALGVFAPWLFAQRRLRTWLKRSGQLATTSRYYQILPTLEALALTGLIAAIWPAVLAYFAWRLSSPWEATSSAKAVASGLWQTAAWFFPLEFLRQMCRPGGLAEAHFDWPAGTLRVVSRHLRWFVPAGTLLVFLAALMDAQGIEKWQNSVGRLAFIALMLMVVVFVHMVLRPGCGLFRHLLAAGYRGWFHRFRHVWYTIGMIAPASLALLCGVGYYYTARQLAVRLWETVYLPLVLVVLGAILARWILVVRRRLAIQRLRARRAEAEAMAAAAPAPAGIPTGPAATEPEPDLGAVSTQTRRLLNSFLAVAAVIGVWWIWVEVLPALGILDRVELWTTTVKVAEPAAAPDGSPAMATTERVEAITLANLGLAVLVFLMTAVAARNVPGLLEISMPRRLPLDAGIRYAITTMTRYVLIAVGVIVGFGVLGIGWSKVQWLVAALSVGLGFGLQEIFANFVSGLIILFERPIRIGDIVTVADVTGVVTRIQTRATIVTNWDRQEFIVPNKEFVTGRLLNWTRSDTINRVVINVGIAYGSDTERARQLLEKILREHPEVMKDPAPLVSFEGFGESSLNIVVRCYLPRLDKRLATVHELHTAIDQAFREAGIEIAFPQLDLHVRSDVDPSKKAERPETYSAEP